MSDEKPKTVPRPEYEQYLRALLWGCLERDGWCGASQQPESPIPEYGMVLAFTRKRKPTMLVFDRSKGPARLIFPKEAKGQDAQFGAEGWLTETRCK